MDRGNANPTHALPWRLRGNHEKNPNPFAQHRDLNSELFENESSVTNFDQRSAMLCAIKTSSQTTLHSERELK